ncbi:MAG: molybdate ABC transporter substrate-binding protein [Nocardioidaceae bacterium]
MKPNRVFTVAVVVALPLATASCSSDSSGSDKSTLTVLAASSLTEAFTTLETQYESDHPDIDVVFSFDSSATLAEQVTQGAPADVLATADEDTMKTVTDAGDAAGTPQIFTTNTMVIVTPPDNPAGVTDVSDLANSSVKLSLCDETAPCGSAAKELLTLDHVNATPVSFEPDVKSVLTKVTLGEVDAGIVYASDAHTAGHDVSTVQITNADQVVNSYPIAVLKDAPQPAAAQDWVDLVRSSAGQKVLANDGFGAP